MLSSTLRSQEKEGGVALHWGELRGVGVAVSRGLCVCIGVHLKIAVQAWARAPQWCGYCLSTQQIQGRGRADPLIMQPSSRRGNGVRYFPLWEGTRVHRQPPGNQLARGGEGAQLKFRHFVHHNNYFPSVLVPSMQNQFTAPKPLPS